MNVDGLRTVINQATGLGIPGYDSLESLAVIPYGQGFYNSRALLDGYHRALWQCRKVTDYLPQLMRRCWGTVTLGNGDPAVIAQINKRLRPLRGLYQMAQQIANLYGGSCVLRLVNDGADPSEPIQRDRIEFINYSRPLDRWEIFPHPDYYLSNPYDPEYYQFFSSYGTGHLATDIEQNKFVYTIHKSRVIRFKGAFISLEEQRKNQGWEASLLEAFLQPVLSYVSSLGYVSSTLQSFELVTLLISGLFEKTQTPEGEAQILQRLRLMQQSMSALRAIAADKDTEGIEIKERRYQGIQPILETLKDEMIGASGLTKPQFYQEHPSGLAATGESERLAEANSLLALCEEKWTDNIEQDIELLLLSKDSPTKGKLPDDWGWEWQSLYAKTPTEEASIRKSTAETDKINIESGVYGADEARQSHYGGSQFDVNISLNEQSFIKEQNRRETVAKLATREKQIKELTEKTEIPSDRLDSLTDEELKVIWSRHQTIN